MRNRPASRSSLERSMWRPASARKGAAGGRLPTFVIAGFPKCGTTALAAFLDAHPAVYIAPQKEVHFFDEHFGRGVDWYRAQFAAASAVPAVGEATPTYAVTETVVARMAQVVPEARIIVVLRNPVDRAASHYWWMRAAVGFEQRPFEEAIRAEMRDPEGATTHPHFGYLRGGLYAEHLDMVHRFFPKNAVLGVFADELKATAQETFAGVCRFLGVADDVRPPNLGSLVNPAFQRRSFGLNYLMLRVHAFRWLPFAYSIDHLNRKPLSYPPITPEFRRELSAWFTPENRRLSRQLGREIPPAWNG